MMELTQVAVQTVTAPPLVPAGRPIDREHLQRMTLGDRALEREVLSLFERQTAMLLERIEIATAPVAAAAAHTLMGSAKAIGAFAIAQAAADIEQAATSGIVSDRAEATSNLRAAVREAKAEIDDLLALA